MRQVWTARPRRRSSSASLSVAVLTIPKRFEIRILVRGDGTRTACLSPRQAINGMSSIGIVTKGRIMSRSSCSRM